MRIRDATMTDDKTPNFDQPPSSLRDKVGITKSGDTVKAMMSRTEKTIAVLSEEFVE
jgi:hypothetical protein